MFLFVCFFVVFFFEINFDFAIFWYKRIPFGVFVNLAAIIIMQIV